MRCAIIFLAPPDTNIDGTDFILQPGKHSLHYRPDLEPLGLGRTQLRLRLDQQWKLGFALAASVRIDDRLVVAVLTGLRNRRGIVGRMHDFIQIGDPLGTHLHQGDGDLGIVDAGRSQQGADRDLAISDIKVKLVSAPPEHFPVVALLAADIAGGGDAFEHRLDGFGLELHFQPGLRNSSGSC